MTFGVDFAWGRPSVATLSSPIPDVGSLSFVARYYSNDPSKSLSASEASGYLEAGLDIVVVWEDAAGAALNGEPQGVTDGKAAVAQAAACGQPPASCIYFAVDEDAPAGSFEIIAAYFDGARSVLGSHRVGGYGSASLMQSLQTGGHVDCVWQTSAWSCGKVVPGINLLQTTRQVSIDGVTCDLDQAMALTFGGWRSSSPPPPAPPPAPPIIVEVDVNLTRASTEISLDNSGKGWQVVPVPFDQLISVLVNGADPRAAGYVPIPVPSADAIGTQTQIELVNGPPNGAVGVYYWHLS